MKREQVERLEALLAEASPGPWHCGDGPGRYQHRIVGGRYHTAEFVCDVFTTPDAALIREAINALPALLQLAKAVADSGEG